MRRRIFTIGLACLCGCLPNAKKVDHSQEINSGVNIVPEPVLAALKSAPSTQPTDEELPDVIDVIRDSDQHHKTVMDLLRASGLVPTLQKAGPFTILAPTDEAFTKLPPGSVDRLLLPSHHDELVAFVKYHLIGSRISFGDMLQTDGQIPTISGQAVIIKGIGDKAMINDANVLRSDTGASNGMVHWIDTVLLAPA